MKYLLPSEIDQYHGLRVKKIGLKSKTFKIKENQALKKGKIVRIHSKSKMLKNDRDIDIYLPPGYKEQPHKHFPVLYMHDGNNLFYPEKSFAGVTWQVNQTTDLLINKGFIEEIIIVGIYNTPQRCGEYTWTKMKFMNGNIEGGEGQLYADYLRNEIKPLIDQKFRTIKDAKSTGVLGSSLGGLISLYLGIHCPDLFNKIGLFSPSLWWDYGKAFRDIEKISSDLEIWLDMGTKEGHYRNKQENMLITSIRLMKEKLHNLNYVNGYNMAYLEDRGAKHDEASWARRFHLALLFFYGKGNKKNIIFTRS